MVVWGKSNDHKLPPLEPEKQILGKESETKCNDKVITIKSSDEVCDKHSQTADV
ncbi:hypothetical protein Hanom_Chr11g01054031 [Helianthus anomalus]